MHASDARDVIARAVRAPDDGARIAYVARRARGVEAAPSAPIALFVNGLSNHCFQLSALANDRAARGAWAIEYDFRGHGSSENPKIPSRTSAVSFARDAWAVVDDFASASGTRAGRIDVVAYSFGVRVAMEMVRQRRDGVRLLVAVLGSPERILDGLLGRRLADVAVAAGDVLGARAMTVLVRAALTLAATAPRVIWALARVLGLLRSSYRAFEPFFAHLRRLDAETWVRCVLDGHKTSAMDMWTDENRNWRVACIAGDRDFAAPLTVMRSWEKYTDFFWMLKGVAHDGLRSHGASILALTREAFDRVDEMEKVQMRRNTR